jgi:hypothetical protein
VTDYTGTRIDAPDGIAVGPDGALWFTNFHSDSIGRITTAGVVSNYRDQAIYFPEGITAGPDGAIWFANFERNSIGRIALPPVTSVSPSSGGTGTSIIVSGSSFPAQKKVHVTYETGLNRPKTVSLCDVPANPDGTFRCSGSIPSDASAGANGAHTIKATGAHSTKAETTFTLS